MAKQDRWPELCRLVESDDGLPVRTCQGWTEHKLQLWNKYIEITTSAMVGKREWSAGVVYVDLFAGPGVCARDTRRLPGSAILAARAPKPFHRIICTEMDVRYAAACRARLGRLIPSEQFEVMDGDCNRLVQSVQAQIPPGALTLAFVDPEGFDIQFQTLETLSRNRAVDFLMLFADAIDLNRNVGEYLESQGSKLDSFFGPGLDWRSRLLAMDDFGDGKLSRVVRELLESQMRSKLRYSVFDYKTINGPKGKLYDLIFASKHPKGLEFFEKIKKWEPGGQGMFSWSSAD